eukprot:scaffold16571_cov122-Isochrysis_galbana.AAC.7
MALPCAAPSAHAVPSRSTCSASIWVAVLSLPGQPTATESRLPLDAINLRRGGLGLSSTSAWNRCGAKWRGRAAPAAHWNGGTCTPAKQTEERALPEARHGDLAADDDDSRESHAQPEGGGEEDQGRADQELVSHGVQEGAKLGLHLPTPGQVAVREVRRGQEGE